MILHGGCGFVLLVEFVRPAEDCTMIQPPPTTEQGMRQSTVYPGGVPPITDWQPSNVSIKFPLNVFEMESPDPLLY